MEKCARGADEEAWLGRSLARGTLLLAPCQTRGDDDLFSLSLAVQHSAWLVSNDRFADQVGRVAGAAGVPVDTVQRWLDDKIITYGWAGDNFVPHPLAATRAMKDMRSTPSTLLLTAAAGSGGGGGSSGGGGGGGGGAGTARYDSGGAAAPPPLSVAGGSAATLCVAIPGDRAGAVIGRGGTTIKQIQARTGTHVDVPREGDAGNPAVRTVVITGSSLAACEAARAEVLAALQQHDTPAGGAPPPPGHAIFHATVSDERAGALIGKGGATIRDLQERSGCRIQVAPSPDAAGLRLVTIAGPLAGVQQARAQVAAIAEALRFSN
jgi:far upstream element-binding protein